jgi:phosphoribosylformylglycinamidine synthase
MATPKVCVLRAPGTNCDIETAWAFELAGAKPERLHLNRLLENPARLADFQILCIPGGFSYGDDLGAGIIFSRQLRGQLNDAIRQFLTADKLVLGICNGFQTILKAGLLMRRGVASPAESGLESEVTLTWNSNGRYTDRWVRLKVASSNSAFLRDIDERQPQLLEQLRQHNQIALCYWSARAAQLAATSGDPTRIELLPEPENPNGSLANIAGLCDETGKVLGLMPHPERFLFATQHPHWTRKGLRGEGDGIRIFRNAVTWFA